MVQRLLLIAAALVGASLAVGEPAGADCSGPTLERLEPAVRGDTITIRGYAFGDNCYDTGPPPEGEGALGVPIPEVELFIAQGDGEVMVARGAADDEYAFSVDVTVPPRLSPGPARVVARWGSSTSTEQTFDVLADPPTAEPPGTTPVESFGPAATAPTTTAAPSAVPRSGASAPEPDDEPAPWATEGPTGWIVAGVGVVALAVVAAFLVVVRRRARAASDARDR